MARAQAYERMLTSMRSVFHLIARSSDGAYILELDGVMASVTPKVPERSLPNSVIYESQEALIAALPELMRRYEEEGIDAWTVWTPEDDTEAASALRDAGHTLDADPAAMALDLATLDEPPDIEHRTGDDLMPVIAEINDRAYGHDDAPFTRMFAKHPRGVTRNYVAEVDGRPAACLLILPVEGDASVYWVATLPEARGHGLASRLMHRALWDAREAGCDISTLQATKLGEPVYARLGYESHGALQMWEKRR
jgi:GNAT superfamily N-acetyltransferase